MKRNNRKGFTLAELLIVVAIIAVLTAIAVPLFVSSLNQAKKSVFLANKDAVRSAGIAAVLSSTKINISELTLNDVIVVTGTFEKTGTEADGQTVKLKDVTVEKVAKTAITGKEETKFEGWKDTDPIIVHLTPTELKDAAGE